MKFVFMFGVALLFMLSGPFLELLGWRFSDDEGASPFVKLHPSLYAFAAVAIAALAAMRNRELLLILRPYVACFIITAFVLTTWSIIISSRNAGAASGTIVTFLLPVFILFGLPLIKIRDYKRLSWGLRFFFLVNSSMGLIEQIIGGRLIPGPLDAFPNEWRSAALLGHPLNASMLTGMMVVYLATAQNLRQPAVRWAELPLHVLAMFAFGGRTSLVLVPAVIAFGSLRGRRQGAPRKTALQRLTPIALLLLGAGVAFLPIPFVEGALERFTSDQASSETRNAALQMVGTLDWRSLMLGISSDETTKLMLLFNSPYGIELAWVALTMNFGLSFTIPLAASLIFLLLGLARALDQSAMNMGVFFLLSTAGSLSIGSKSLLLAQSVLLIVILCQRLPRERQMPRRRALRSGFIGHRQEITVAARAIAEKKALGQRW